MLLCLFNWLAGSKRIAKHFAFQHFDWEYPMKVILETGRGSKLNICILLLSVGRHHPASSQCFKTYLWLKFIIPKTTVIIIKTISFISFKYIRDSKRFWLSCLGPLFCFVCVFVCLFVCFFAFKGIIFHWHWAIFKF